MKSGIAGLGLLILIIGIALCVYPERTLESYVNARQRGYNLTSCDYYCPYQIVGLIVALIGFVTLCIGFSIPNIQEGRRR